MGPRVYCRFHHLRDFYGAIIRGSFRLLSTYTYPYKCVKIRIILILWDATIRDRYKYNEIYLKTPITSSSGYGSAVRKQWTMYLYVINKWMLWSKTLSCMLIKSCRLGVGFQWQLLYVLYLRQRRTAATKEVLGPVNYKRTT